MTAKELSDKWEAHLKHSDHIFTWTEREILCFIAEEASKAKNALETGVYMGRTSKVMLDAGVGHLWSIDPFMVPGTQKVTEYFLRHYISNGTCEIIPKHTKPATDMLQHMRGKIDFSMIDDGHAFEDVITDITCILPLMRSGGVIAGHDYETAPLNDVAKAVRHLLPKHIEILPRLWYYKVP